MNLQKIRGAKRHCMVLEMQIRAHARRDMPFDECLNRVDEDLRARYQAVLAVINHFEKCALERGLAFRMADGRVVLRQPVRRWAPWP